MPKNSVSLSLITTSIMLLLALQFFWLRKEYNDQKAAFHRETHSMLRNVLFELTDSLVMQHIEPLENASWKQTDSITGEVVSFEQKITDTAKSVQIFISSTTSTDTLRNVIRPLIGRFRKGPIARNFVVRLPSDSVSLQQVENRFRADLHRAQIELPFTLGRDDSQFHHAGRVGQGEVLTPSGKYQLAFSGLDNFLLMKIYPQILFSLFLTLITIASFAIMFRSLRMQQRLVEIKNGFIGNITHELKTPITTVGVALEALRNFKGLQDPKRTEEYLAIAESELKRLSLLTDKVLKSALFESSEAHFNFQQVDLAALFEQVIQSMKLVIEKSGATIDFQKNGEDYQVSGDCDHLQNVFFNLLDNSLKYTRPPIAIRVHLAADKDQVRIAVHDNGIGIPKVHQKKVFEKFYRVPTGDVHNAKGHGLGLSYVDSVVAGHQGTIEVESEEGKGCSFIVTLPRHHES